ncbi:hypothetical protein [Sporofaciens musculi]|nr:hypothetical protein [Sporofaciens musculi]
MADGQAVRAASHRKIIGQVRRNKVQRLRFRLDGNSRKRRIG